MATTNPQVLIVGRDTQLAEELRGVLAALPDIHAIIRHASDPALAGDAARSWQPRVAMLQMTGDLSTLRSLVRDIRAASPETSIVGLFRSDLFPPEVSESSVLIQAIRVGVQDFVRRPISSHDVSQLFDRLLSEPTGPTAEPATLVSFISNKGGIGKSTLAVNVAVGLAQKHPERVLLVDCSLQMGVCASSLGMRPSTTLYDAARERDRLDETLIRQLAVPHESGLDLLAAPGNALEATEVDEDTISRVLSLARRTYDYVIVDSFPVFDRVVMAILDQSMRSYFVLDNLVPTVLGGARLLGLLEGLEFPLERQGVILNRFMSVAGALRQQDVESKLDRPVDHVIRFDRRIIVSSNIGQPFLLQASRFSAARRAMWGLVNEVEKLREAPATPRDTEAMRRPSFSSPAADDSDPKEGTMP
jgi:pilus assembly protein CpaE